MSYWDKYNDIQLRKQKILEHGHSMCNAVSNLQKGESIIVEEEKWIPFWELQFNPEKGETADGELKRWLASLKELDIIYTYEMLDRKYKFHRMNKSPDQSSEYRPEPKSVEDKMLLHYAEIEEKVEKGEWFRADGDCICGVCGKEYKRHQYLSERFYWLVELCDGTLVKL